jgi:hypothetical protein
MENTIKELMELGNFIHENKMSGGLPSNVADQVKELWNEYKLTEITNDCAIIEGDFGRLGSLIIRDILETGKKQTLKYESGSYDFISIRCDKQRNILWTDYEDIEPYNRQSGLYCGGASFEYMGAPVKETNRYREFNFEYDCISNVSFAVWGFGYNDYYQSVTFGICLKKEQGDEFIGKLRKIIDK